jgi:hypothetical protein
LINRGQPIVSVGLFTVEGIYKQPNKILAWCSNPFGNFTGIYRFPDPFLPCDGVPPPQSVLHISSLLVGKSATVAEINR